MRESTESTENRENIQLIISNQIKNSENNISNKINNIEQQLNIIHNKLDSLLNVCNIDIKENCNKMSHHIDFIENIYKSIKKPLNYLIDSLNNTKYIEDSNYLDESYMITYPDLFYLDI